MATAKELKDEGNEFFKQKNYDKAIELYTQAISLEPNDHVLYSNRSACYINQGNFQKALEDGDKCVALNAGWWKGYHKQGLAYFGLEDYEKAIEKYNKGLELDKDNQTIKSSLVEAQQKMKEESNPFAKNFSKLYTDPRTSRYMSDPTFVNLLQMGMKDPNMLTGMMGKDPRFMDVFSVLTGIDLSKMEEDQQKNKKKREEEEKKKKEEDEARRIQEEKERKEKAERDRFNQMTDEEKQMENIKKEAESLKLQGNEHFKKKEFAEALKFYQMANEKNPKELVYYLNLAGCYHELKEYSKVIECCNYVIENTFDFERKAKAYGRIAFAYQEMGEIEKAIDYFERSLLEKSDNQIKVYHKEAMAIKAKLDAERYINPEIAEEHNTKANEFYKAGKWSDAIREYSEAIKRFPSNAKFYNNRAAALIKCADIGHALKDCEDALKIDPQSLRAYQRLGTCNTLLRKYHRAVEAYETGLKLHPDDQELKDGLAKVNNLIRFGDGSSDEERMQRAMEDPEIAELVKHPRIQQLFKEFKENPKAAQESVMKDAWIQGAFNKLVQAGIIKTG